MLKGKSRWIIIMLMFIIVLIGIFLSQDFHQKSVKIHPTPKPSGMTITVKKADNTTKTVQINESGAGTKK